MTEKKQVIAKGDKQEARFVGNRRKRSETATSPDERDGFLLSQAQEELAHTRELLRKSREEYEAANEELRAANEELQSINEYRSTGEELETSKEELQSMNEELQTLNTELKAKLDSTSRANSDMQNLMAATEVGTLFLDTSLRIKLFTPPIADLFRVVPGDEGRPIADFAHGLKYSNLAADARKVLRNLTPFETELESEEGRWFLMRMRPYRTIDDRIDGVVITFVDVNARKRSEERLKTMTAELDHRVKNILARVLALCEMTATENNSPQAAGVVAKLCGRIRSMAKTHTLLSRTQWGGADLRTICDTELSPYRLNGNVNISGPSFFLNADAAQAITYVIHELTTNAVKYGALSSPQGRVDVRLSVSGGPDGELRIDWREMDGPPVTAPTFVGYGINVITDLLRHELDAQIDLRFPKTGLECEIAIPLAAIDAGKVQGLRE